MRQPLVVVPQAHMFSKKEPGGKSAMTETLEGVDEDCDMVD